MTAGPEVERHRDELFALVRETIHKGLNDGLIPSTGSVYVSISDGVNMKVYVAADLDSMGPDSSGDSEAVTIRMDMEVQLLAGITEHNERG